MTGFFDRLGRLGGKAVRAATGPLPVISHDFRPGELVWVYPQDRVPYGARIVVQPNQAAIVIRSGKVLAVLRQGEWALDTAHVPGLRGVLEELYEGVPLPVRIVFVNVTERDIPFGGRGNTKDMVPVQYRGMVHVVVPDNDEDIKRFALRIAGEEKVFTTEELAERMRLYINDLVESYLGSFLSIDVQQGKHRLRELLRGEIAREIQENWYLRVKSVAVDIDIPEEWLRRLQETGYGQMLALAATNPQVAQFMQSYDLQRRLMDALAKAQGGNVAGLALLIPLLQQFAQQMSLGGQQQQAQQLQQLLQQIQQQLQGQGRVSPEQAQRLQQLLGAAGAAGAAAAQQAAQQPPGQGPSVPRQQAQAQPGGYVPRCPYCGADLSQFASMRPRFCPMCGKPLKWCPNGHVAPAEAKYCPVCGAKLD